MSKIIFFDTETTGLDPKIHGMHQLAGNVVIDDEVVAKFDYKINPFKGCEIDRKALEVSNTSTLDFLKYHTEVQVMFMFTQMLDKYISTLNESDRLIIATWARDPAFDKNFLEAFFKRNASSVTEIDRYFYSNFIDVKSLASQYLLNERHKLDSFSLAPVARHLGIYVDESQLHRASYDAYLCRKVYEIVTNTRIVDKKILKKVKR